MFYKDIIFIFIILPAIFLTYQHNSAHYAKPVAPNGCPFEINPPEGLTTIYPPYVKAPLSIYSPALPIGHNYKA